jgi:hypothetical protein
LRRESKVKGSENLSKEQGERTNLDLATNQNLMNLAKSGGKKRGEKKVCEVQTTWKNLRNNQIFL